MSICSLTLFEKHCPAAAGGFRKITLYLPDEVAAVPVWANQVYSANEPTLADGKTAYELPFDSFSGSLTSQPNTGPAGDFWTHTINVRFRRNRKEIGLWLRQLQNRRVHLVTEDFYGIRMWWPDMRISANRQHGERFPDGNLFNFTFSRRWQHPGVYLPEIIDPSNIPSIWGNGSEGWGDGSSEFWGFPGE